MLIIVSKRNKIQIQPMLRLNGLRQDLFGAGELNSNTTNVKVKL